MTVSHMTLVVIVAILIVLVVGISLVLRSPIDYSKLMPVQSAPTEEMAKPSDAMGLHGTKSDMKTVVPENVAPEVEKIRSQIQAINDKPCGLSPHDVPYHPPKPGAPTVEKCYQDGELVRFDVTKKYTVGGRKIVYYFDVSGLIWSQEKEYDNDLEMDPRTNVAASKAKYISSYFQDSKIIYQESNHVVSKDPGFSQKETKRIQDELAVFKETL